MPTKEQIGSKAFNLADLESSGFPVPEHFVVATDVYDVFLTDSDIPEDVFIAILDEYNRHFGENELVAVRSSANFEDSADDSFAGVYESYLNTSRATLRDAILNVYRSVYSSQAKKYYEENGIDPSKVKMAVIVQKQIDPLISGVCFTKNPVNGQNQIVIEYVEGLNEAFVQGEITPQRIILNSNGDVITASEDKYIELIKQSVPTFSKVEDHYSKPQDIEWAVDKGQKTYILQSRDITTIDLQSETDEAPVEGTVITQGIGISSGVVTGVINRVDTSLTAAELKNTINKGDIVVAHSLRIDQIEAIVEAGGIILSEASLLSHIAIRTRELKIPCVGGVDVSKQLESGQELTINGNNGLIYTGKIKNIEAVAQTDQFPTYYNQDKVQIFETDDFTFLYARNIIESNLIFYCSVLSYIIPI